MKRLIYSLAALAMLAMLVYGSAGAVDSASSASTIQPLSLVRLAAEALHVFPPLGHDQGTVAKLDPTLRDYLLVSICKVEPGGGCTTVLDFTGESIVLRDHRYHVNWKIQKKYAGGEFQFTFSVTHPELFEPRLDLGTLKYRTKAGRMLPISFRIDHNPAIVAWLLRFVQGASAVEIAEALEGFGLDPDELIQILYDLGFSGSDACQVLKQVFSIDDVIQLEAILDAVGYDEHEYIGCTAYRIVERFAPILRFNSPPNHLPMDAQVWFDEMLCGEQGGPPKSGGGYDYAACRTHDPGWGNLYMYPLVAGQVPTYYRARRAPDSGQLRIDYWWFYGHQPPCDVYGHGEHMADWEKVMIITNQAQTKVAAVVYDQHSGWYTKIVGQGPPNFPYEEDFDPEIGGYLRPIVFVGENSHGAYHNTRHFTTPLLTCAYFEDWRDPGPDTKWYTHESPLLDLDGNEQAWMAADRTADWRWQEYPAPGTHPTQKPIEFARKSCKGRDPFDAYGCGINWSLVVQTDCKMGDCCCGLGGCVSDCWKCALAPWEIYALDWTIPTTDMWLIPHGP
jgi:phage terminase large subunit-like protein